MMANKVKINGVSINLDVVSTMSAKDLKALDLFPENADASMDALNKEIEKFKALTPKPEKVEVVK